MTAAPGDWVRYYRDGHLVLGVVQYTRTTITGEVEYLTDCGVTREGFVLEVRSRRSEENFKHPTGKAVDRLITEQENK